MNKIFLFILVFVSYVCAEQETLIGYGTGYGSTQIEAKRNAIRDAVEKTCGTFIQSETDVNNNQLVKDKILSYSNALISSYEIIDEKFDSIQYIVKVKVIIAERLLSYTIKKEKGLFNIDSDNLYEKTVFKFETIENAIALIKNFRHDYFQLNWMFNLKEKDIKEDFEQKKVTITYTLSVAQSKDFGKNVDNFLRLFKNKTKIEEIEKELSSKLEFVHLDFCARLIDKAGSSSDIQIGQIYFAVNGKGFTTCKRIGCVTKPEWQTEFQIKLGLAELKNLANIEIYNNLIDENTELCYYTTIKNQTRFLSDRNWESKIIKILEPGYGVCLYDFGENNFWKVQIGNAIGYIHNLDINETNETKEIHEKWWEKK